MIRKTILKYALAVQLLTAFAVIGKAQCSFERMLFPFNQSYGIHKIFPRMNNEFTAVFQTYGSSKEFLNLIHFDTCQTILWRKTIDLSALNVGLVLDVIQSPDSGFMLLANIKEANTSPFILKIDKLGSIDWFKTYDIGSSVKSYSILFIPWDRTYLVSGYREKRAFNGGKIECPYIFKVDSMGAMIDAKDIAIGDDSSLFFYSSLIAALPDSSIFAALYSQSLSTTMLVKLTNKLDTISINRTFTNQYYRFYFGKTFIVDSISKNVLAIINCTMKEPLEDKSVLAEIDFNGEVKIVRDLEELPQTGYYFIKPALDNGFLIGPTFNKFNSSYELEQTKKLDERVQIMDIVQLMDSSYVLPGNRFNQYLEQRNQNDFARPYIQKTNKQGWLVGEKDIVPAKNQLAVYPNPANETLTIKGGEGSVMRLVNIAGHTVLKEELVGDKVDIANVPDGFYLLYLQTQEGAHLSYKLTIQH